MDMSKARPSERIRFQQDVIRQQDELIDLLKGALAAAGLHMGGKPEPWLSELTTQERALVGALFARFPRVVDRYDLLDSLPGYSNSEDRQVQILNVVVHRIRKKLGEDAIYTARGEGFRLGDRFYAELKSKSVSPEAIVSPEPRSAFG
jgi:DNA-binding response OmpR family regulator